MHLGTQAVEHHHAAAADGQGVDAADALAAVALGCHLARDAADAAELGPGRAAAVGQTLFEAGFRIIEVPLNRPGALHDMLVPLKTHGVSMTRLESRPARSGQWEYYFYIDVEGHPDEPRVGQALQELREACAFFKVLGTYPIDVH